MKKANHTGIPNRSKPCTGQHSAGVGAGWAVPQVVLVICVLFSFVISQATAQNPSPRTPAKPAISGAVRDASGKAVQNASVILEHQDASAATRTTTDAQGLFVFSDLANGTYLLSAESSGQRSRAIPVVVPSPSDQRQVELTLQDADKVVSDPGSPSAPTMEFADQPNFTVAAVTDWTAAGGHGSDAVLRTSEALTRETMTLRPQGAGAGGSAAASRETESSLRAALVNAPASFDTNHRLGEFYLNAGRFGEAIPLLQAAYRIDLKNSDNEYSLALAMKANGEFAPARDHAQKLLANKDNKDNAELHRLAGELDEELGDPLAAVHEFERAVREDPSEQNYFDWGSELLLHRAVWQAKDVFAAGAKAYPKSARMLTALGAALFAGALYDDAAKRLCEASDLSPADQEPYLFMGRIEMAVPNPLPCVEEKLKRFVDQRPGDALANYFYAMTLWKQNGQSTNPQTIRPVEELLIKAVSIDSKCSDAYLQLGVLQSAQHNYDKAVEYYSKAIEANPQFGEAHYRLGVAYDRIGEKERAKQEFQRHDEIDKQEKAAVEQQRREVKQFLVVVDGRPSDLLPH